MEKKIVISFGDKKKPNYSDTIKISPQDLESLSEFEALGKTISFLNRVEESLCLGKKFPHLFEFEKISLWWFLRPSLITPLKNIINFIESFEKILHEKKPQLVIINGHFEYLNLIISLCNDKKIPVKFNKFDYNKFKIKEKLSYKIQKYRFKKITKHKISNRLKIFKERKNEIPSLTNNVVFAVATSYRRPIYDNNDRKSKQGEYIQGPLMAIVQKIGNKVIGIDLDYTFRGDLQVLKERIDDSNDWLPLETICEFSNLERYKKFQNYYKKIISYSEFQSQFNYKEINFWNSIKDSFYIFSYLPHIPTYLQLINSLESFFAEHQPKAVFIPYETGPLALAIILSCEKNKIPTIGIQHGLIFDFSPDYSVSNFRTKINPLGIPIPTYMLLFGNYAKNKLVSNNYPEEKLIVLGHPEFFELEKISNSLQSNDIKEKYTIPKNKKIILFTTAKHQKYYNTTGNRIYDEQILDKLLENFSNVKDYFVIVKPHPTEFNVKNYEHLISKFGSTNFKIIRGELFEILHISNIIISVYSNSILDSIVFGIPTISVNFSKQQFSKILGDKGALFETDLQNLIPTISSIMSGQINEQKHKEARKFFMKEHYNIPSVEPEKLLQQIIEKDNSSEPYDNIDSSS